MESVDVRSRGPVSADVRLMISHSTRTAGGNPADPTGAFPAAAAEENRPPPGKQKKRRKKKGFRALCRRIGKAIKRHILCWDEDDIACSDPEPPPESDPVPPPESDPEPPPESDPEPPPESDPEPPPESDPEPPPESDPEPPPESDPEPPPESDPEPPPVPGPSALDSGTPGPSGLGTAFVFDIWFVENQTNKSRKKKAIRVFLRRRWRAVKRSVRGFQRGNKVAPDSLADEPVALQDPADQTDPEPPPESDPEPPPESDPEAPPESDPEPPPVPGPSALDSGIPGPSGLGAAVGKQKKRRMKAICELFHRRWRAVKRSVRRFQRGNKVAPYSLADEPVALQDPADQTDPEPPPESDPEPPPESDPEPPPVSDPEPPPVSDPEPPPVSDPEPPPESDPEPPPESDPEPPPESDPEPPPESDPEPPPVPGPSALDSETPGPSGLGAAVGSISSFYEVKREIGRGCYGIVHEGTRRFDGQKVAIKFIPKNSWNMFIELPGSTKPLLEEVAVNLHMRTSPKSPHIVQMLDWFDEPEQYALIMEYPHPCETLFRFAMRKGGCLNETVARGLMRQAVLAAKLCVDRGVYHKDIKTNNILVNTETLQLKLIDFGCSELFKTSKTREWAVESSVWSLGRVLLETVTGAKPLSVLYSRRPDPLSLSKECQDLIKQCMGKNRCRSLTLEQMLGHAWFEQD